MYATIKNALEKKQKSFVASYSNSANFQSSNLKEARVLAIRGYAMNSIDDVEDTDMIAEYRLNLSPDAKSLAIKMDKVLLKKSKARYKRNENLSVAITIKGFSFTEDASGKTELKEAEGTIVIPLIHVSESEQPLAGKQAINEIYLPGISFVNSKNVKFSVTVLETNIDHIDPSIFQNAVVNNGADIQAILKAIFGVSDK